MKPPLPPDKAHDAVPLELLDEPGPHVATATQVDFDFLDDAAISGEETAAAVVREERELELVPGPETVRARRGARATRAEPRRPEDVVDLRVVRAENWCRVCGTRHESGECPGELLASGPERHGWRATFETPRGTRETHAILIAPAAGRWRARIMTYPRALWTLPGCPRTIKFVADLPAEAERLARQLVEEHCRDRQCTQLSEESSKLEISSYEREELATRTGEEAARRRPRALPIQYAIHGQPLQKSTTAELSETGLFIVTDIGVAKGTLLRLVLELPGVSVPLRGWVRWSRPVASPGRPIGIGVELSRSPAIYLHYVRSVP